MVARLLGYFVRVPFDSFLLPFRPVRASFLVDFVFVSETCVYEENWLPTADRPPGYSNKRTIFPPRGTRVSYREYPSLAGKKQDLRVEETE